MPLAKMADDDRQAELAEDAAHQPGQEHEGDEHGRQGDGHAQDGEADLLRPPQGRRPGAARRTSPSGGRRSPGTRSRRRPGTRSPTSGPSGTGCPGCTPAGSCTTNVSSSDSGRATAGMIVSAARPRNRKMTSTTRMKAMTSVSWTSLMLSMIDAGPVVDHPQVDAGRERLLDVRDLGPDGLARRRPRWPRRRGRWGPRRWPTARPAFSIVLARVVGVGHLVVAEPEAGVLPLVLDAVDRPGHVPQVDGAALELADDHVVVAGGAVPSWPWG